MPFIYPLTHWLVHVLEAAKTETLLAALFVISFRLLSLPEYPGFLL